MNNIKETLRILKSLNYKTSIRHSYINKLTKEDLILFDKNIQEFKYLPDIHLHSEDIRCHTLGLTILNYLYDKNEIIRWFHGCLEHFFMTIPENKRKITPFENIHRSILGLTYISLDLGFEERFNRKLFSDYFKNYKRKLPYPKNLVQSYLKAIENREPLIEAIDETTQIYRKDYYHTFIRIIDSDILPIIGIEGFKEYIEDMVQQFKLIRKVNPDIPINQKDFSYFITGNCEKFQLRYFLKLKGTSKEWFRAYLEALLPEFIKAKKINRQKIYQLLELDEDQIQEWETIYLRESSKWSLRNSYNIQEVNPGRLSEKDYLSLTKAINELIEPFKVVRKVPLGKEILKQLEEENKNLFRKFRNDRSVVMNLILNEIEVLKNEYYQTRTECIDFKSDLWRYYNKVNENIWCAKLDFSLIRSQQLKKELKIVFKYLILNNSDVDKFRFLLSRGEKFEEMFNINSFKDISALNLQAFYHYLLFNENLNLHTISHYNTSFIKAFDILIKEVPSLNLINEARDIELHNLRAHGEKTKIIPESVLQKIDKHLDEVPENIRLIFKLFMTTGWRYKEVIGLKPEDFREVKGYPDLIEVETTSTKTASTRKEAGYTLHPCDFIPIELYDQLKEYLAKTYEERKFYNIKTCFYVIRNGISYLLPSINFNNAINKLIQKYHITDEEGNLWHFNTRQTRKKVAITLIQNNVPFNVVQQKLTHQCSRTTQLYYTESREIELAQVNEAYFKEYVEAHLSQGIQEELPESELKKLYLNYRNYLELENGICTKLSCSRLKKNNCSNCTKLCTGNLYLSKWKKLLKSVQNIKADLVNLYRKNKIESETYLFFKEYQNLEHRESVLIGVIDEIERKNSRTNYK